MSRGGERAPATEAEVCTATPRDVPTLAVAMARAFVDDPVMGWLLPDARRRHEGLRRFFELELRLVGLAHGCVWTTGLRDGAAIATPPGRWRLPWPVALRHGLAFTRAFGTRLPVAAALLQLMEHRHIRERHYYLPYIGVVPASQGRGLGTKLITPTLLRCDQLGVPAYLEATSPRNAALYERLGFVSLGELRFAGSPPLLLMRRPPR
jgi:GNAT superfamily N-acetyltransferase